MQNCIHFSRRLSILGISHKFVLLIIAVLSFLLQICDTFVLLILVFVNYHMIYYKCALVVFIFDL